MINTLLIADDSTGANASTILLNQLHFTTISLIDYKNAKAIPGYDAIAVSTDSRGIDSKSAYDRVINVLESFKDEEVVVLNKRIDSTLRGNLGSELNAFRDIFPKRKIAIVPSFPNSFRTCRNGLVFVKDILLEKTDVAKDPKMPITSSDAKTIFMKQFKGRIANIYLETIRNKVGLSKKIEDFYQYHDAIVFDAETNSDIEIISEALVLLDLDLITVDPGSFTYYYTKAKLKEKKRNANRYLYLVGSVTDTTFEQLKIASHHEAFDIIALDPNELLDQANAKMQIEHVLAQVEKSDKQFLLLTTTNPVDRKVLNLFQYAKEMNITVDALSKEINDHLSMLLDTVLSTDHTIKGIFTSGGDTTLSFLTHTESIGIELKKEVLPLCVYGKIIGGRYDGFPIITKGGMIGNDDAYIKIKDFFQEEMTK